VLGDAEGQDGAVGERAHRDHRGVVGVEDGGAAACEPLHQFAFGFGDGSARAEVAEVGLADVEDDGDVRGDEFGERGDVADAARAEFQGEEPGGVVGARRGAW
jgi:hypothetical protein